MAGNIKGITIEFRGDTTKLDKALRKVRTDTKDIDKELKDVNRALKFNPRNTELLAQKQTLLKQKVEQTSKSLKDLKDIQAQMDAQKVDPGSEEYRKLQREIITTESKLKHFQGELQQTAMQASKIYQVGQAFDDAGKKIESAGHAMAGLSRAAGAVSAAMAGITYKAGAMADDLNTLSKVTGISTYDLQMYAATADLVDVSVEAMAKGHQKLKKSMLTASEGGSTLQYFDQLGISVTDSNGELRDANDVFNETIQALGKMENETQRDAIAMAIFGKSAGELNPLIEDGGETYAKVAKIMEEHGLEPVSQEVLDQANAFNDSLDTIKLVATQALQIIGSKIAAYLVPIMEKVADKIAAFAEWLASQDGEVLAKIMGILGAIALISPALIVVGKVISMVGTAIQTATQIVGGLSKAMSFLAANPIVLVIAAVAALVAGIVYLWQTNENFRNFIISMWTAITTFFSNTITAIKTFFLNGLNAIMAAWSAVTGFFSGLWAGIKNVFAGVAGWFGSVFGQAWQAIKSKFSGWASFWGGLWTKIKNKFSAIGTHISSAISGAVRSGVNGVISRIESIINSAVSIINGAINLINKIPGVSVGHVSAVSFPRLAKGGVLNGAQTVIAGEAGPEAIIPLDRLFAQMDRMAETIKGPAGGDNVTINVYASPGMNIRELAAEIEARLVRQQKQREKAWA